MVLLNGDHLFISVAGGYNLGFPDASFVTEPVYQLEPDVWKVSQRWKIMRSNLKVAVEVFRTRGDDDWESKRIFAVNKGERHSTFIPFVGTEEIRGDSSYTRLWVRNHSSCYLLLSDS